MNEQTPLSEVEGLLPEFSTDILNRCEPLVRQAALVSLREVITYWEDQRQVFDPIAFERILDGLVAVIVPLLMEIKERVAYAQRLEARVAGADILIAAMSETISELTIGIADLGERT